VISDYFQDVSNKINIR